MSEHNRGMRRRCYRVVGPSAIDLDAASLVYLPTLGLHALRAGGYEVGSNVVVIGQGIVGVLAALIAQLAGARTVALEIASQRRLLATRAGVDAVAGPAEIA